MPQLDGLEETAEEGVYTEEKWANGSFGHWPGTSKIGVKIVDFLTPRII